MKLGLQDFFKANAPEQFCSSDLSLFFSGCRVVVTPHSLHRWSWVWSDSVAARVPWFGFVIIHHAGFMLYLCISLLFYPLCHSTCFLHGLIEYTVAHSFQIVFCIEDNASHLRLAGSLPFTKFRLNLRNRDDNFTHSLGLVSLNFFF